mmetsp:Transcript_22042/g.61174  ORF Transcript_22042/g.61174 Transcript_22042/m.61174 type:complete len:654 (+) Transcript_22042:72-2033(+)
MSLLGAVDGDGRRESGGRVATAIPRQDSSKRTKRRLVGKGPYALFLLVLAWGLWGFLSTVLHSDLKEERRPLGNTRARLRALWESGAELSHKLRRRHKDVSAGGNASEETALNGMEGAAGAASPPVQGGHGLPAASQSADESGYRAHGDQLNSSESLGVPPWDVIGEELLLPGEQEEGEPAAGQRPAMILRSGNSIALNGSEAEGGTEEGSEELDGEDMGEDEEDSGSVSAGDSSNSTVSKLRHGQSYMDCPLEEEPGPIGLEGIDISLPHGNTKDDVFITRRNHERILKDKLAIHKKSVALLPDSSSEIFSNLTWGTCAVVGNSGILRAGRFGSAIDAHDVVLRTNQAPTYSAIYKALVGRKTTMRLLNHLWTSHYATRMKKMSLPLEQNTWLLLSRTDGHLFDKLAASMQASRPDVRVLMLTSRVVTMARRALLAYRIRLCKSGRGPYKGGAVPTSGLVAIMLFIQLCQSVTVYGFGRELAADSTVWLKPKVPYHYFVGHQARQEGVPVHSWPAEEKFVAALHKAGFIQQCSPILGSTRASWVRNHDCGVRAPPPLPTTVHLTGRTPGNLPSAGQQRPGAASRARGSSGGSGRASSSSARGHKAGRGGARAQLPGMAEGDQLTDVRGKQNLNSVYRSQVLRKQKIQQGGLT